MICANFESDGWNEKRVDEKQKLNITRTKIKQHRGQNISFSLIQFNINIYLKKDTRKC